ncbi:MAG TPA: AAA family ATPase [Burkholderiales bacterium]
MNDAKDLAVALKSRFPIIPIETHDEPRVLSLLENLSNLAGHAFFTWAVTAGIQRTNRKESVPQSNDLVEALKHLVKTPQDGIYALLDAHPYLNDPINLRLIREVALGYQKVARTLVFVSPKLQLPPELARMSMRFSLSVLDAAGVKELINEEASLWQKEGGEGEAPKGNKEAVQLLSQHLSGLSRDDARRLIRQAIRDDNRLDMEDVTRILKFKHQSVAADSLLSLELDTSSFTSVAGLANLKRWLERRRQPFTGETEAAGLDAPKGILLLGVQGCGKSMAAKAVAGTWRVPLLRLDFGVLYNKFYGETERNLRDALAAAEAMQPCVLWIDEIEKGVATDSAGDSDGGVSRRVLGTLLTWMSERKSKVFMVATANDIAMLPPELVRKGRFDEIFFVDLPAEGARAEIFRIHLARRKQKAEDLDVGAFAAATEGFSGTEIEQIVVSSLYEALARNEPLSSPIVKEEIVRTKPLSLTMSERISALKAWAEGRTVSAD